MFWKRAGFKRGEREIDLLVHAHCIIFLFSSVFSLIFFFSFSCFLLFCFLFIPQHPLFFRSFFRARQGSFYSACRDQFFTTLLLNRLCLVWTYLPTTKEFVCVPLTLARQRQVCFIRQSTIALLPATT